MSKSTSDRNVVQQALIRALTGRDAHVEIGSVLGGMDWKLAGVRPAGGCWPGKDRPASRREWERTTRRLEKAVGALRTRARDVDLWPRRGRWTPLEMLLVIGSHTSYHVGQITALRQSLGVWPPPSGGVTW